jgi:hypothetical protein
MEQSQINRISIPDLREFFVRRKKEIKGEINSCLVGIIESFNVSEQTANINIAFKKIIKYGNPIDAESAADKIIDYPLLVRCPVVIMNGGGGHLTFPISKGDECLVLFCDKDIDSWFSSGSTLIPNSERVHDLSDGIALIGPKSLRASLSGYLSDTVELYSEAMVRIKAIEEMDIVSGADVILRGSEVALGLPADSVPEGSTTETRRIWVVDSVSGNEVTLTERRITLGVPPSPVTKTVTIS